MLTTSRCLTRTQFIKAKGKNALDRLSRMVFFNLYSLQWGKRRNGIRGGNWLPRSEAARPTQPVPAIPSDYFLSLAQLPVVLSYRLSKKFSPVPVVKKSSRKSSKPRPVKRKLGLEKKEDPYPLIRSLFLAIRVKSFSLCKSSWRFSPVNLQMESGSAVHNTTLQLQVMSSRIKFFRIFV